jgi:Protein of unknown function (DUF2934)
VIDSKAGVRQNSPSVHVQTASASTAGFEREPVPSAVSDDEIRNHAYQLYERRGRTEGRVLEDWLAAEGYLRSRKNRANKVIFR